MRSSSDWLRSMSVLAAGSGGKGVVPSTDANSQTRLNFGQTTIKQQATLTLPSVMRSSSDWLHSMSVLAAGSGGNGVVPNSIQYKITPQLQMSNFPIPFSCEPMTVCDSIFSAGKNY
jgi:hypothetical protein